MYVQMNCCGVDGPQDYMHTSWYNHSKDTEGFFVPPSCCVLKNDDPRGRPRVANENFCQVDAIFYISPKNNTDRLGYLKTQVRTHIISLVLPSYLFGILVNVLSIYLRSCLLKFLIFIYLAVWFTSCITVECHSNIS